MPSRTEFIVGPSRFPSARSPTPPLPPRRRPEGASGEATLRWGGPSDFQFASTSANPVFVTQPAYEDLPEDDEQGPPNDGVADDGVDLLRMTAGSAILSLQVYNGQSAQEAILDIRRTSLSVLSDALNAAFTEVDLSLVPLDGGPFEHEIDVIVTDLMVPKTIDLEAVESA